MSPDTSNTLIVVPAWNEEGSVADVVGELVSASYAVLVVDDGSTDRTGVLARSAGANVCRLPINLGVGAALRCGFKWAVEHEFAAVIQVDADGQHPAALIEDLIAAAQDEDVDLVLGSRFAGAAAGMDIGIARRTAMRMLGRSASRATGTRITDATSGFRIIKEPLLSAFAESFPAHYLGDTYEALVSAGRAGYVVREIPAEMKPRTHGQSSASPVSALRLLVRAVIVAGARLDFPLPSRESHPRSR